MANVENPGSNEGQPGGIPFGSRQGGAPDRLEDQTRGSQSGNDVDLIPEP